MQMVEIPKQKYEELLLKAEEFDRIVEAEGLTEEELARLEQARQTPLLTKKEFLRRHPELEN